MALLPILEYPDPRLRTKAKSVSRFDEALRTQIAHMFETMYAAPGIGLAATQVDYHKQLFVLDTSKNKDTPLVFINPKIFERQGVEEMEEGCLSFPGVYAMVERAESLIVKAFDGHGKPFEMQATELLAVCIQHELDHLEGKLFVDYLSALKRNRIRKKLLKEQKSVASQ